MKEKKSETEEEVVRVRRKKEEK